MSARLEALAREKEILVMRSALCRLRLRRDRLAIRATRALLVVKLARVAIGFVRGRAKPAVCGIEQTAS